MIEFDAVELIQILSPQFPGRVKLRLQFRRLLTCPFLKSGGLLQIFEQITDPTSQFSNYTMVPDPALQDCLWVVRDNPQPVIYTVNAKTGAANGCGTLDQVFDFSSSPIVPRMGCNNDATVPAPGIGNRLPFISSTLTSFRPVDVKFGPDGALYLTDWSNPIIGHYQTSFRHPDRDKTHGRIWRITTEGRPLVKQPVLIASASGARVTPAPVPALLDHLKSPDRFTRLQARRLLSASDPAAVAIALPTWIEGLDPQDPGLEHHLFEALGIYAERVIFIQIMNIVVCSLCQNREGAGRVLEHKPLLRARRNSKSIVLVPRTAESQTVSKVAGGCCFG